MKHCNVREQCTFRTPRRIIKPVGTDPRRSSQPGLGDRPGIGRDLRRSRAASRRSAKRRPEYQVCRGSGWIAITSDLRCRLWARRLQGVEDGGPVVADGAQTAFRRGGDGNLRHALTALPQVTGRRDAGGEGRGTSGRSTLGLTSRLAVPAFLGRGAGRAVRTVVVVPGPTRDAPGRRRSMVLSVQAGFGKTERLG